MCRIAPLVLVVASACAERTVIPPPPAPVWIYAPEPIAWPAPTPHARIGRSEAPQPIASLGVTGPAGLPPLRLPTVWAVPRVAGKPALAAVVGALPSAVGSKAAETSAIELIDIDAGKVLWRDTTSCTGVIFGVTEESIICASGAGAVGLSMTGVIAWKNPNAFVAMSDERLVLIDGTSAFVIDANDGTELARTAMPAGVRVDYLIAACGDAGRELFAVNRDNALVRILEGTGAAKGGPVTAWTATEPLAGPAVTVAACEGDSIVILDDAKRLSAYRRADGVRTGYVDGVSGWWPSRGTPAALEVASTGGVYTWSRELGGQGERLALPAIGPMIASDGARRLVRVDEDDTAVLLDDKGIAAYVPLRGLSAALGDGAVVAGSWSGATDTVRRYALPARLTKPPYIPRAAHPVVLPAELRDEPAVGQPREMVTTHIGSTVSGPVEAPAIALNATTVFAAGPGGQLVAFDVADKKVRWQRDEGCLEQVHHDLAIANQVVVCASQDFTQGAGYVASVRATAIADGAALWEWNAPIIDGILAHGTVVAVLAVDRATLLASATGKVLGHVASDVALVPGPGGGTYVVSVEHGMLVARAPQLHLMGVWSVAIDGVVARLHTAGDGVLVELTDGDAYRVSNTGDVSALPAVGVSWVPGADVLASVAPAAGAHGVAPDRQAVPAPAKSAIPEPMPDKDAPQPPRLWIPIPPPEPARPAVQVTLYELGGGVRARNDYAMGEAALGLRSAGAPIVLLSSGTESTQALVIDAATGDPLRRVELPELPAVFSTTAGDNAIVGAVVADPLRVVGF